MSAKLDLSSQWEAERGRLGLHSGLDGWARKSKGQRTGQAGEEPVKRLSRTGMVGVETGSI